MPLSKDKRKVVWTEIDGDNDAAIKRRREAYDRWFHICTCGHGADQHDPPGGCNVKSCGCRGYDHISGKPDHPLADLPADDPRLKAALDHARRERP